MYGLYSCFSFYFGEKCLWIDCDPSSSDQSINSTKGCSSSGVFTFVSKCKCNEEYEGKFCQDRQGGNGGVVAAVVVTLLLAFCGSVIVTSIVIYVYLKHVRKSKSEELERLILQSVNDWTMLQLAFRNDPSRSKTKNINNAKLDLN